MTDEFITDIIHSDNERHNSVNTNSCQKRYHTNREYLRKHWLPCHSTQCNNDNFYGKNEIGRDCRFHFSFFCCRIILFVFFHNFCIFFFPVKKKFYNFPTSFISQIPSPKNKNIFKKHRKKKVK